MRVGWILLGSAGTPLESEMADVLIDGTFYDTRFLNGHGLAESYSQANRVVSVLGRDGAPTAALDMDLCTAEWSRRMGELAERR